MPTWCAILKIARITWDCAIVKILLDYLTISGTGACVALRKNDLYKSLWLWTQPRWYVSVPTRVTTITFLTHNRNFYLLKVISFGYFSVKRTIFLSLGLRLAWAVEGRALVSEIQKWCDCFVRQARYIMHMDKVLCMIFVNQGRGTFAYISQDSSADRKEWIQIVLQVKANSIILATGATAKKLGLPSEQEFWNKGISACAICDGEFFVVNAQLGLGGDVYCKLRMFSLFLFFFLTLFKKVWFLTVKVRPLTLQVHVTPIVMLVTYI